MRGIMVKGVSPKRNVSLKQLHANLFRFSFTDTKSEVDFMSCSGGEIGRHACLRCMWRDPCGFESRPEHHLFFENRKLEIKENYNVNEI